MGVLAGATRKDEGVEKAPARPSAGLLGSRVLCQPEGQFGFSDLAGGEAQECEASLFLACGYGKSIELKKHEGRVHRRSLVSIDEWVIAGDAERIGGGQLGHG